MPGLDTRVELRFDSEMLAAVDRWRQDQTGAPSLSHAIRQLVEKGLEADRPQSGEFAPTGAERLMLVMLSEIHQQLEIDRDIVPKFVSSVIWGGQDWSMPWMYDWLFWKETPSAAVVEEVASILSMWRDLEFGYAALTEKQKQQVAKDLGQTDVEVEFEGFDGNEEGEHHSVAKFMTRELKRFDEFSKRDLNSHRRTLGGYRRMLAEYSSHKSRDRLPPSAISAILGAA